MIAPSVHPRDPLAIAYDRSYERSMLAIKDSIPTYPHSPDKRVSVLSFGAGQDSTAILYRLILDKEFQATVPGRLIIVMADTGNEYPTTMKHVSFCQWLCERAGIEFVFLSALSLIHI